LSQEAEVCQRKAAEAAETTDTWRNRFADLEHRYGGLLARLEAVESDRQAEVKHHRDHIPVIYRESALFISGVEVVKHIY
jgi:hypothetical protein